jgi:hypothetical protein
MDLSPFGLKLSQQNKFIMHDTPMVDPDVLHKIDIFGDKKLGISIGVVHFFGDVSGAVWYPSIVEQVHVCQS